MEKAICFLKAWWFFFLGSISIASWVVSTVYFLSICINGEGNSLTPGQIFEEIFMAAFLAFFLSLLLCIAYGNKSLVKLFKIYAKWNPFFAAYRLPFGMFRLGRVIYRFDLR